MDGFIFKEVYMILCSDFLKHDVYGPLLKEKDFRKRLEAFEALNRDDPSYLHSTLVHDMALFPIDYSIIEKLQWNWDKSQRSRVTCHTYLIRLKLDDSWEDLPMITFFEKALSIATGESVDVHKIPRSKIIQYMRWFVNIRKTIVLPESHIDL
jgi:hypothetical protein